METQGVTLEQIAAKTKAKILGDPKALIEDVADLKSATNKHISFLSHDKYLTDFEETDAKAVFVQEAKAHKSASVLIVSNPSEAFQIALEMLRKQMPQTLFKARHPTSVIHETAFIDEGVSIGPYAVVDGSARIGKNTQIMPHAYIGPHVTIGEGCVIHAHAVIREGVALGDRVIIQPGAVIGACGFGYNTKKDGSHQKIKHFGSVTLQDDVEIGSLTAIDRGRFGQTVIGCGTKIDNLVQIAHNVQTGSHCLIVSQSGIAGSSQLGSHVVLGGQCGITGHVKIESQVMVASKSGVSKSLKGPGKYGGMHAAPLKEYLEQSIEIKRLKKLSQKVEALSKRLEELERVS